MTLESLSKTQARQFAKTLERLNGLPWKIVIIIDSTLPPRASLHPENSLPDSFSPLNEDMKSDKNW